MGGTREVWEIDGGGFLSPGDCRGVIMFSRCCDSTFEFWRRVVSAMLSMEGEYPLKM